MVVRVLHILGRDRHDTHSAMVRAGRDHGWAAGPLACVYRCRTAPDHLAADLLAGTLSSRGLTTSVAGLPTVPPEAMALSPSPEGILEATKGQRK